MRRVALAISLLLLAFQAPVSNADPGLDLSGITAEAPRARAMREAGPLSFVLDRPLREGGKTRVRLRNTGSRAYVYNPDYEACDMVYRDATGREFLIPEGTHCDLQSDAYVRPGETVTLFRWDLDECIEDNWGCVKARDLPAGKYSMRGWFRPKSGGDAVKVFERFRIRRN